MATASRFASYEKKSRIPDDAFVTSKNQPKEPKPSPTAWQHVCPYCEQSLSNAPSSISSVFGGGVHRLLIAVCMIMGAMLRCARFAIASGLCLIGLIGSLCRALGTRIAHPDDRRFLREMVQWRER